MRIAKETLDHDGRPIFEFHNGEAQLYHDDYADGPTYRLTGLSGGRHSARAPRQSKADCVQEKPPKFHYRQSVSSFLCTGDQDGRRAIGATDEKLRRLVPPLLSGNMGSIGDLFAALRQCLPAFNSIRLKESGEDSRALKAVFNSPGGGTIDYGFDQLSDGQRALIALYSLILLTGDRRVSLFIDEPDNYLALREIQPWLVQARERCGTSLEQLVVVSHHPIIIDYMAGASGRWFFREGDGPHA